MHEINWNYKWVWRNDDKSLDVYRDHRTWLRGDDGHSATSTLGDLLWGVSWLRLSSTLAGRTTSRHDLLHEVFGFGLRLCCSWLFMVYVITQWFQVWCKFGHVHIVELCIFHPWDISVVLKIIQDPRLTNWSLKHWHGTLECWLEGLELPDRNVAVIVCGGHGWILWKNSMILGIEVLASMTRFLESLAFRARSGSWRVTNPTARWVLQFGGADLRFLLLIVSCDKLVIFF